MGSSEANSAARRAPIQQQADHAAPSAMIWSSRLLTANCSACRLSSSSGSGYSCLNSARSGYEGDDFDHAAYAETHAADAGLPIHQFGVDGDAVELEVHVASVDVSGPAVGTTAKRFLP